MRRPIGPLRLALALGPALALVHCSSTSKNEGSGGGAGTGGGGGAPAGAQAHCGTLNCDLADDQCCFAANDSGVLDVGCRWAGEACPVELPASLKCDDTADCGGALYCCANIKTDCLDSTLEHCITSAQCVAASSCAGGDVMILCDPAATGSCPADMVCKSYPGTVRNGLCVIP